MILAIPAQVALASVSNPNVVAGSAGISQGGNTTTVNMGSAQAVINWDSLNTASNEILQFLKASGNFAVLNRVIRGGATQFDGSLFGNQGHIIVVNPHGIVFGPTALIQAHKFTASALDIANTDFMNGHYQFVGGAEIGTVSNYGNIAAGQVALIGKQVLNAGVISSPGGYVLMAAGDKVFLGQDGSNIVVEVEGVTVPDMTDAAAAGIGDVINEGTIEAAGGKIVLAAGDTFSRAISGLDSLSLAVESGTGRVGQFGILSADGVEGDGGSITITAGDVVALSSDSVTTANAGTNGDGGQVIVYSPDTALFREGAQIQAKGGSESGDGGFIEVSGKKHVEVFGSADASATNGTGGLFFIDPYNITIQDADPGTLITNPFIANAVSSTVSDDAIEGQLDGGTSVLIRTADALSEPSESGTITQNVQIDKTAGGDATLTYDAAGDIVLNSGIVSTVGKLNVDLRANSATGGTPTGTGSVDIGAAITTNGGSFTSSGVNFDNTGGIITTAGGAIAVNHTGTVTLGADLNAGAGAMSGTATSINVASNLAEIHDAIGIADTGGADISVDPGTYDEGQFDIDKPVTLQSTGGAGSTTIKVDGYGICVVADDVTVDGFTVTTDAGDVIGLLWVGTDTSGTGHAVDNVTITDNVFRDFSTDDTEQHYGVAIASNQSVTNIAVTDNDFLNLTATATDVGIGGVLVRNDGVAPQGVTITGNVMDDIAAPDGGAVGIAILGGGAGGAGNGIDIHDNTISNISGDYSAGIAIVASTNINNTGNEIFNSEAGIYIEDADDVTITQDNIHDNTVGIHIASLLGPATITQNYIRSNDDTGVYVESSADQVAINYNDISGNTTWGVFNDDSVALDAEGNWWGAANGPSGVGPGTTGDAVSSNVDYSPWLGIGTDGSADPGFQPVSSMMWWTNDSIQDAIDMASTTVPEKIVAVAGTYNESVNVDKQLDGLSFAGTHADSEITGTLTLSNDAADWDGGTLDIDTVDTDLVTPSNKNLTLNTVTDNGDHSLTLDTGTGTTYLEGPVTVGNDLTLMSNAASDGDMVLTAGDSIYANGTLSTTSGGDIDLYSSDSTTYLYDDVTAAGDITLHNTSIVADDKTLTAGDDVFILALLTAQGNLNIEATGGAIEADAIFMNADNKLLSLTQNDNLNMEQALDDVYNSDDTDLFAKSTAGSVTSSKADTWKSIEANAKTFINLNDSDTGGDIRTEALTTTDGDILITSNFGKVYATGTISAGQDVKITAKEEGPFDLDDAIILDIHEVTDLQAGRDIWLNNNTWAAADMKIVAGQDVRLGFESPATYNPKTLTGAGALTVEAGRHITLGGAVDASALTSGNLVLWADKDSGGLPGGDMIAYSTIDNPGGSIDIYSSDGTTYLYNNVTASYDLNLHNNTVVQRANAALSAGHDLTLDDGKTLEAISGLWLEADNDLTLGGPVTTSVVSASNLHLHADADFDGIGNMWAKDTVTNDGGIVNAGGHICIKGRTIDLVGAVSAGNYLMITANEQGLSGENGNVTAQSTLTAGGKIEITADDHIDLQDTVHAVGNVTVGNITLIADAADSDTFGDVDAEELIAGGTIDISASDTTINLHDNVTAGDDIILNNNTVADSGVILSAGDDIHVGGDDTVSGENGPTVAVDPVISSYLAKSLTGNGDLTLNSGLNGDGYGNILLGGAVTTVGKLTMNAGITDGWDETNVKVNGLVNTGELEVIAGGNIEFYSNVLSSDHIVLAAYDDVQTFNGSSITMTKPGTSIFINAGDNGSIIGAGDRNVEITGNVDSAGGITIHSDDNVDIDGYVESGTGYINITADDGDGDLMGSIDIGGYVDSGAQMYLYAGDDITLNSWAKSAGDMLIKANWNADGTGNVTAYGTLESTGGSIDIYSADTTTFLHDNVTASLDIKLHNNTWVADGKKLDAGRDVIVGDGTANGKTLTGEGDLEVEADRHITFGGDVTADGDLYLYADADDTDGGDVTAHGTLTTTGSDIYIYGENIEVDGAVDSSGNIEMHAAEDITLDDTVTANAGTIKLIADSDGAFGTDDGTGDLWAKASVSSGGSLEARGNNVTFDGPVSSTLAMILQADSTEDGTGDLWAKDSVTVTDIGSGGYLQAYGNNVTFDGSVSSATGMWLIADSTIFGTDGIGDLLAKDSVTSGGSLEAYGNNITFEGPVSSIDFMVLYADSTGNGTGSVDVSGLVAGGDIDIYASDNTINIHKSADPLATADVHSDQDIRLWNDTVADADVKLYAGDDVVLSSGKTITGSGNLDIEAADDIMFGVYIATHEATDPPDGSSSGSSGDVTAAGNLILTAGDDIYARGELSTTSGGIITATAADNINLYNTPISANADGTLTLTANSDSTGGGDLTVDGALYGNMQLSGVNVTVYGDVESDGILDVDADDDIELRANVSSVGEMTMDAGNDIKLNADSGDTTSNSNMTLTADNDVYAHGKLTTLDGSEGNINIYASDSTIHLYDDVTADLTDGGDIILHADTEAADGVTLAAGRDVIVGEYSTNCPAHLYGDGDLTINAGRDITAYGKVDVDDTLIMDAEEDISVYRRIDAGGYLDMDAIDITVGDFVEEIGGRVYGNDGIDIYASHDFMSRCGLESNDGYIDVEAGHDIYAGGYVYADTSVDMLAGNDITLGKYVQADDGHLFLTATEGSITVGGLERNSDEPVHRGGPLYAYDGDMILNAGEDIIFKTAWVDNGSMIMNAGRDILAGGMVIDDYDDGEPIYLDKGGRLEVTVDSEFGATEMTLTADRDISFKSAYIEHGDLTATAERDIILRGDVTDNCLYDEVVESSHGNVYLHSLGGDISIAGGYEILGGELGFHEVGEGEWEAHGGGVSLIADNGKIYSPGGDDDTLNITIVGTSDQAEGIGVELPLDPDQKAAIVLISKEDLKLGEDAVLTAFGMYDNSGAVDDRAGVGFLDDGDPATATIGGILRDEGDPFDVAIYLASTDGDVDVSGPVSIMSRGQIEGPDVYQGAMVIDAFDSVTFGDLFEDFLADGDVGDRLEVVSRITEWLYQAVGRLSYPYGGGPFPPGYHYVLRGAGLDNPGITDGRAWVLENPTEWVPFGKTQVPGAEAITFAEGGCPPLMAWFAGELGLPEETIRVYLADAFLYSTAIQPCDACARLNAAATILEDTEGARIAALALVVNEFVTPDAPIAPEQMASIASAMISPEAGTYYAAAGQWLDALAEYVGILNTEMGFSVPESVAAVDKHVTPIAEGDNVSLAAYVAARLATLGG